MFIDRYLMGGNAILIAGAILFFCGCSMDSLIGNIAGSIGFIMVCYALIYSDLKELIRSKRE